MTGIPWKSLELFEIFEIPRYMFTTLLKYLPLCGLAFKI